MNSTGTRRGTQRGSTIAGVLLGLIIGIVIAAALALYISFGPQPFSSIKPESGRSKQTQSSIAVPESSEPIALPGKPGEKPVEKPKFDFYKILPGGETASAPSLESRPAVRVPERLYLQAGAYQNPSDADNLRARLALMGIESNVLRVDLAEKGVFYRVRLGPFPNIGDADAVRARMATEGIESVLVRSTPQPLSSAAKTAGAVAPKQ